MADAATPPNPKGAENRPNPKEAAGNAENAPNAGNAAAAANGGNAQEAARKPIIDNWCNYFPVVFAIETGTLILLCYVMGLINGHFHFFLPFLAELGSNHEEAAVFCCGTIFCSVTWMITATIRYLQLRAIIWDPRFMFLNAEVHRRMVRETRARDIPRLGAYRLISTAKTSQDSSSSSDDDPERGLVDKKTSRRGPPLHPIPPLPQPPGNIQYDEHDNFDDITHFYKPADEREFLLGLNFFVFLIGITAGLSGCGVAVYRINESLLYHNLAATGLLTMATAYIFGQMYFSWRLYPQVNSKKMFYYRLKIAFVITISLALFLLIYFVLAFVPRYAPFRDPHRRAMWNTGDEGFWLHALGAICQWTYFGSVATFIYTFLHDFHRLRFDAMKLDFVFGHLMTATDLRKTFWWHRCYAMNKFHRLERQEGDDRESTASKPEKAPPAAEANMETPARIRGPHSDEDEENVLFQRG